MAIIIVIIRETTQLNQKQIIRENNYLLKTLM